MTPAKGRRLVYLSAFFVEELMKDREQTAQKLVTNAPADMTVVDVAFEPCARNLVLVCESAAWEPGPAGAPHPEFTVVCHVTRLAEGGRRAGLGKLPDQVPVYQTPDPEAYQADPPGLGNVTAFDPARRRQREGTRP